MKISVIVKLNSNKVEVLELSNGSYLVRISPKTRRRAVNEELVNALADFFEIASNNIEVLSGLRRRRKIVYIDKYKKYKRGVTVGAFDLCHAGHMLMFKECKEVCDFLIVGIQDDPSMSVDVSYRFKEKGGQIKDEPVMSLEERRIIFDAIKYIDEVFVYTTEEDLYNKLKTLDYDVRVLGADWKGKKYTGYDLPHTPYFNSRDHSFSTSELRNRIYQQEKQKREEKSQSIEKTTADFGVSNSLKSSGRT